MINIVFILLKQSKDESKHSPLERKDITKGLSESTKEQKKSDEEGKFYSFRCISFCGMISKCQ